MKVLTDILERGPAAADDVNFLSKTGIIQFSWLCHKPTDCLVEWFHHDKRPFRKHVLPLLVCLLPFALVMEVKRSRCHTPHPIGNRSVHKDAHVNVPSTDKLFEYTKFQLCVCANSVPLSGVCVDLPSEMDPNFEEIICKLIFGQNVNDGTIENFILRRVLSTYVFIVSKEIKLRS